MSLYATHCTLYVMHCILLRTESLTQTGTSFEKAVAMQRNKPECLGLLKDCFAVADEQALLAINTGQPTPCCAVISRTVDVLLVGCSAVPDRLHQVVVLQDSKCRLWNIGQGL